MTFTLPYVSNVSNSNKPVTPHRSSPSEADHVSVLPPAAPRVNRFRDLVGEDIPVQMVEHFSSPSTSQLYPPTQAPAQDLQETTMTLRSKYRTAHD